MWTKITKHHNGKKDVLCTILNDKGEVERLDNGWMCALVGEIRRTDDPLEDGEYKFMCKGHAGGVDLAEA